MMNDRLRWMQMALELAQESASHNEVPVGAVIVLDGELIGKGHNCAISNIDATAHAEMNALRDAFSTIGNYRIPGCEMYCTLEPCAMCAGAMIHARVGRLIYGASDIRWGAAGSVIDILSEQHFNHKINVEGGILAAESALLLKSFFRAKRKKG